MALMLGHTGSGTIAGEESEIENWKENQITPAKLNHLVVGCIEAKFCKKICDGRAI